MVTINPISRAAEAELLDVIANTIGAVELLSSDRVDPIVGGTCPQGNHCPGSFCSRDFGVCVASF